VFYTREQLQDCLSRSNADGRTGDEGRPKSEGLPAAVLIGLVNRPDGPTILLTKRTDHLKDHAGQICFPGGRIEAEDASIEAAALREAEEEIGLAPEKVDIVSRLAPYDTSTGFCVHPVVGWIEPPITFELDPFEVAEVFELPLSFALDPQNHQKQSHLRGTKRRRRPLHLGRHRWHAGDLRQSAQNAIKILFRWHVR